jgi:hypothetical protein
MDGKQIGIIAVSLAVAGCGGSHGGKGPPPLMPPMEMSGVLLAGRVSGVEYATATRSGKTDATGTFRFLPGETVTFSIGQVELGRVPATATITPFSLAGTSAPTTERALRGELDRATRVATAFGRAINIERLLMALDVDNDPANGLSVGDQADALAPGELDLDVTVAQFATQLRKRVPHLTGNLPNSQPLVFLYRALELQVPVHAEERVVTTLPAVPDYPSIVTRTRYDDTGARASQGFDFDGDEHADVENTWRYDALSRLTAQSMQSIAVAGLPPASVQLAIHYDAGGNLLGTEEQQDDDGSGVPDLRLLRTLVNDDHGFAMTDVVDTDNGADGTIDSRRSTNFRFDGHHNVTGVTDELDFGVDAVAEERHTVEASYDLRDRQLELTARTDHEADGAIDLSSHEVFQYDDDSAAATRHLEDHDFDADGVVDTRIVTTATHDDAGFPLTELSEYDSDGDGKLDLVSLTTFTYDAQHRMLSQEDRVDHDGDGEFEELDRTTRAYDEIGNPLSVVSEFDIVDGVAGFTSQVTNRYGAFGERLEVRLDSRLEGAAEFTSINDSVFMHTLIADGVHTLAQQYLDDFGGGMTDDGGVIASAPPPF